MITQLHRIILIAALAAGLAACSSRAADREGALQLTTGSLAESPPSFGECARRSQEIGDRLQQARALPAVAKAQRAEPPSTIAYVFAWLSAERGGGVPAVEDFERQRAVIRDLERASRERGCQPMVIEPALAEIETALLSP